MGETPKISLNQASVRNDQQFKKGGGGNNTFFRPASSRLVLFLFLSIESPPSSDRSNRTRRSTQLQQHHRRPNLNKSTVNPNTTTESPDQETGNGKRSSIERYREIRVFFLSWNVLMFSSLTFFLRDTVRCSFC